MTPKIRLALLTACWTSLSNLRLLSMWTPRYFSTSVVSSSFDIHIQGAHFQSSSLYICVGEISFATFQPTIVDGRYQLAVCHSRQWFGRFGRPLCHQATTCGRSLMNTMNRMGPSTLPCGVPLVNLVHSDIAPLTITLWYLSVCAGHSISFQFLY